MLDEAELLHLLSDAPYGEYVLQTRNGLRLLLRLSDGCPPDDETLEPAPDWASLATNKPSF